MYDDRPKNEGGCPTESSLFLGETAAFSQVSLFIFGHSSYVTALEQNHSQQNGIINSHTKKNQRQLHMEFDPIA